MRTLPRALLHVGTLAAMLTACLHAKKQAGDLGPTVRQDAVTSEDISRAPSLPIEQQLMAKVPGIVVSRTASGDLSIRIRGGESAFNEPLYIVDGQTLQPGTNGALSGINPYDIASIEVVKDAAGTAMYGSRGANGVIIIKTKMSNRRVKKTNQ